jgi:hypothetical protein
MPQDSSDLQRLIDRAAIHDVLVRYFQGIDAADPERVRSCFTDDIRADYDGRTFVNGIDAMMASLRSFRNKASGEWKATSHFMGNLVFGMMSGEVAETETYAFAFLVTPGKDGDRVVMRSLRYLDRLRRTEGGWRICDRVQTLDWSCEVPATHATAMASRVTALLPQRTV